MEKAPIFRICIESIHVGIPDKTRGGLEVRAGLGSGEPN